jgi:hypothetical protein
VSISDRKIRRIAKLLNDYFCRRIESSVPPRLRVIIFLLFCGYSLYSQRQVSWFETNAGAGFRYSSDTTSTFYFNYQVLHELARENLVEVPSVKLRFSAGSSFEVSRDSAGQTLLKVRLGEYALSGFTLYRGFAISSCLIPTFGDIGIIHRDKSDSSLSRTWSFPDVLFRGQETTLPEILLPGYDPATDTLILAISSLKFTGTDLDRLQERIGLIGDYFASASLLDTLLAADRQSRYDSMPLMPYSFCDILELLKVSDLVVSRDFGATLLLTGADSRDLMTKQKEAFRQSRTRAYNFMDLLERSGRIIPAYGIDSMACYFVDGLVGYIRLSAVMSDISGNIYSDYLQKYFDLPAFPSDLDMLDKLARRMWPDARPDTLLRYLSVKVYDAYKMRSGQLIDQHRFAEAYALIRHARLFRDHNPWLKGVNGTEKLLSDAAAGIYSSYLGIAATSIEYDKFALAEVYIQKALEYRRTNEAWFATDTLYASVFQKLFKRRLLYCDDLVTEGQYREAVSCYNDFENSYEPEIIAMVSSWIAAKKDTAWQLLFGQEESLVAYFLKEAQYDSAFQTFNDFTVIFGYLHEDTSRTRRYLAVRASVMPVEFEVYSERAFRALEDRNYRAAWDLCALADRVAAETGRLHDSAFCALQRDAFRYHQMEEISQKTGYIWNDQFDSARIYLDTVTERIRLYGLSEDPALLSAILGYREKILKKQCTNGLEEAEILVLRAARNAELQKYPVALRQYMRAGEIVDSLGTCGMHFPGVGDSIHKYQAPAAYRSGMDTANKMYLLGRFPEAIRSVGELAALYQRGSLRRFGLDSLSLSQYVSDKNNIAFTRVATEASVRDNRTDEALGFLAMMKRQGATAEETRSLQSELGQMVAGRDLAAGMVKECRDKVSEYTGNDRWYREFAKAYCGAL